jgi:hypothetical protein
MQSGEAGWTLKSVEGVIRCETTTLFLTDAMTVNRECLFANLSSGLNKYQKKRRSSAQLRRD